MAQYSFGTIDPNTKSGTALATDLNSWRDAVNSTHSGSTAPSYVTGSMLWSDTTSANFELKMYDGAQWIPVAVLDATNNVARVAVDSAETSYITATTAAQIKHVIASVDTMTVRSTGLQFNIASPIIGDSSNNELLSFTTTASAVNQVNVTNAATGGAPTLSAAGGDTNISIALQPKGTGVVYALTETAATNTIIDVARIEARSSGTPAAGIGTGLLFATETAANNFEVGARIDAVTTDVTATSEDFDLSFKVMAAGAAAVEVMRIRSTGVVDVDALSINNVTVTSTAAELNILDGVTATATELNILDGAIISTNELNYLDSANSNIQTQLDAKAPLASPALTGTPTAPTAAAGTNTTQIATTAFVQTAASPTYAANQATTTGTAFDFTGLPSTVSEIEVLFQGVSVSGTGGVIVQLIVSGTPLTTGYTSSSGTSGAESTSTAGFFMYNSSAAQAFSGAMSIFQAASGIWVASHSVTLGGAEANGGGLRTGVGTVTGIRVTRPGTDTFDAGNVTISYH